ncbi:MAG: hypothetical protein H5T85_03565, partial [Actinobacteria bacterium]|nr:hypothetical protein [Actinomycetota bacterium]
MFKIEKDLKYLLSLYEKVYAKNEVRIKKSLDRVTRALHCQRVDRVPVWQVSQTALYPRHEIFYSTEKNLITQLANIILTLSHKTDYVPYLDPFEGVTILAEAFGCPVEIPLNGDPWVKEPIIRNPDDVYKIKKPDKNNKVYRRVLRTLKFFEREVDYQIPVGVTDPQGPLDVASLIWDNQSFLIACVMN